MTTDAGPLRLADIPEGTRHDLGCRCWPHVPEADYLAAVERVIETARLEYLEGQRAVAAERADCGRKVRDVARAIRDTEIPQAVAAERARIEERLVALYPENSAAVALVCDEAMDRSGAMLGRIRAVLSLVDPRP